MSAPPPPSVVPLHLTPTLVAQHGRFRCDRRLRWEMVPLDARGTTVEAVPPDRRGAPGRPRVGRRPGTGLLTAAGRAWERSRIRRLRARFGDDAVRGAGVDEDGDARRLPYEELLDVLRDPGPVRWIVQPELRLPDPAAWAERWGWGDVPVSVAPSAPDLLRLRVDRDGRVRVGVAEVKWSREGTAAHFAQVAFYGLLLEEIRRAEGIGFAVERRAGWVWTRGAGGPRRFALPAHRHEVERVLREEVPRLAAEPADAVDWTFAPHCGACRWMAVCRDEAERTDDLFRIPGVTPTARALLHERGVETVRALSRSATRPIFDGCHALEVGKDGILQQSRALTYGKAMPHRRPTHRLGEGEGTRLFLCAEPDPVSGRCFALGLRVEREGGRTEEEVWVARADGAAEERRIVSAWLDRIVRAALSSVDAGEEPSGGNGRRRWNDAALRAYLWDRAEAERLHELLVRHLGDATARGPLAELVGMLAPGDGGRAGSPGAVLRDAVEDLYALPVPYDLDLAGVSAALRPRQGAAPYRPRVDYAWPFSSSVAFERAHDLWRARTRKTPWGTEGPGETEARIRSTVVDKLAALSSILRAIRERDGGRGRLRLDDGFAPRTDADPPLHDATLESLRVFVRAEAAISRARTRALHALPWEERARRFECVAGMHLVGRGEDGALTFEFDAASRDAKFRVGDFTLVLTNQDDGETLRQADLHSWKRRALSVELTELDTAADPPRLTVALSSPKDFEKAEKQGWIDLQRVCVLDRADVDFGSQRLVDTLRALDDGAGEAELVRGLLDGRVPEGWPAPLDPSAGRAMLERADAHLPHPVLNPDQRAAWEVAFRDAVTVVWGPPGTGKTYLLAWTLLGLAASARAAGRPLRVLVTAATHRAVVNVLVRVAGCVEDAGLPLPLRAVKLRGSGNDADVDLDGTPVEVVDDTKLEGLLAAADGGEPLVVGGTVWSLWKRMRAAAKSVGEEHPVRSWFDVVVIDEASQVRVPEALLALSSIRAGGRAIVCGDDRQLSPILHGRWRDRTGEADPLLFGSAFALFAERFGRCVLTESRRMNGALVRWPRRLFYPGLVSARADRRLAVGPVGVVSADAASTDAASTGEVVGDELDAKLLELLFDPGDAVLLCTYDGVRAAARNPFEARLAARIARLARHVLLDPETGAPFDDAGFVGRGLAVVSPHRAQNAAILAELRAGGLSPAELPVVDTVERIQGGEREMIVVSYAVADREYAEAEAEFLLDPNRFNVSITRPKAKLVVLVSEAVLRALPRDETVLEGAMAVKGYPAHCSDGEETLEVPDPEHGRVTLRVRRRRV